MSGGAVGSGGEKLAPCPFCGGPASKWPLMSIDGTWYAYFHQCTKCDARGPVSKDQTTASTAWNRRSLSRIEREREEMREALNQASQFCEGLTAYVRHHSTCAVAGNPLPIALPNENGCTCGASDALKGAALARLSTGEQSK